MCWGVAVLPTDTLEVECPAEQFALHQFSQDGLASNCTVLWTSSAASLRDCRQAACEMGGNVINSRDSLCEVRKCEGADWGLTQQQQGFNVYLRPGESQHQPSRHKTWFRATSLSGCLH